MKAISLIHLNRFNKIFIASCILHMKQKNKLDEKRWKNIKTYKWTDTSKELLIALSDENKKKK